MAQNGTLCLICLCAGVPARDLGRSNRRQRWARALVLAISYPSLSAYAESSLIPTLVLSPRKPLRWVFAGAPVLLKFSAVRPRRTAIVRRRVQDRFDLRFPSAAALPISNQPALSEADSAERDAGQIRQPPRKPHPHPQLRGSTSLFPQTQAHPVGDYQFTGAPTRSTPVLPKPDRQGRIWARRFFSLDRERPVSLFGAPKREMGGCIHRPREGDNPQRRPLWKTTSSASPK